MNIQLKTAPDDYSDYNNDCKDVFESAVQPEAGTHSPVAKSKFGDAIKELRSIVGHRYVADDPVIIACNRWIGHIAKVPNNYQMTEEVPVAIVMPSTTEEVQLVMKCCIRHGLRYRAHSTGHTSFSVVTDDNVIALDLRRMNHIEIDPENQMATIGPYTTAQQLQAEAMKHGLTTHIIGAGWTHSPLASATSGWGIGITGHHTGTNMHNLLGWELVTPEGDTVRVGSCGSGDGWFAGEGPGPGIRGMVRGQTGAMSGLGVFTKIGYKLHPWFGPSELEHKGPQPQIGVGLTNRMRIYHPVWKDWEGATQAVYDLAKSNAATFIIRMPPDSIGWTLYATNQEYVDHVDNGTLPEIARNENGCAWTLVAVSEFDEEAEWREQVITDIVEKTDGRFVDVEKDQEEVLARNVLTTCYVPRCFRTGSRQLLSSWGILESFSLIPEITKVTEEAMRPYKEEYKTIDVGAPEEFWIWSQEGRNVWGENIIQTDVDSKKSLGHAISLFMELTDLNRKNPRGVDGFTLGANLVDLYHRAYDADKWMIKIKKAFDPDNRSDGYYPDHERRSLIGYIWPFMTEVFRIFPALRRYIMTKSIK